ncbi:hypothetical protein AXW84_10235 [Hymenobacter sp. PAMC 26628]|nr:hypothetical protein AXW84_10235 [Hymenobacter sp. PAMC 26628]
MLCDLRFSAKDFDIDDAVAMLHFKPYRIWRQGEIANGRTNKIFPDSGFLVAASETDFNFFQQQITDVIAFATVHQDDLQKVKGLMEKSREPSLWFDFGIETRMFNVGVQIDFLPVELLALCAKINAGIKITQYHPSSEGGEESTD